MKDVLVYIEQKNEVYAQLPFFNFLRNPTIQPRQKLIITPCIAHFIMSFQDLNKYIYRNENIKNDMFQEVVNLHTYEDDHHWAWFLADCKRLGFDYDTTFVNVLKFLWSDVTQKTRLLSYKLAAFSLNVAPIYKYIIIEAVEATGNVLFSLTTDITNELKKETHKEYIYFGEFHLAKETGHAVNTSHDLEEKINSYVMTVEERKIAFEYVDKVYEIFAEWVAELLDYAQNPEMQMKVGHQAEEELV